MPDFRLLSYSLVCFFPPYSTRISCLAPLCAFETTSARSPYTVGASNHRSTRSKFNAARSEEHTSELQSLAYLVCRLLLEKKKTTEIQSTKSVRLTTSTQ